MICAAVIISNPTTVSASNEQTAVEDTGEQQPSLRQEIQKLKKGNWVNLTTEQKLEDLDILYQKRGICYEKNHRHVCLYLFIA